MNSELDHLAAAAAPFARFTGYDPVEGRRRIAARIEARRAAASRQTAPACRQIQHQAECELRNLATRVINHIAAPAQLDGLVNSRDVDPIGGLVFAALLYLSGHPRNAQFWFEFAAGSGDSTASFSLYLHHASVGELREAEHWLEQTTQLANQSDGGVPPRPSIPPVHAYMFDTQWHGQNIADDTSDLPRPDLQLRKTVDHLRIVLEDEQLGSFVLPTSEVAEQLHDLVCP
ncbi:hypothetical protein [Kitasatospora sp. NPDC094015]|uniref:hypothetical protein n=1 Tax=Kitasatospora sp. NPDC094015 TaxID=3155205 RepID=UPI00331D790A